MNCPAAASRMPEAQAAQQNRKTEEIVNYEISRTTRTEVTEGGRLKRVSVAVVVDGSYVRNPQGAPVYQPRSQEEMEKIAALVRSAIGFDQAAWRSGRGRQYAAGRPPRAAHQPPIPAGRACCSSPATTSCA